jgi:HEAT repeat protein
MLAWQLDRDPDPLGRLEAIDALTDRLQRDSLAHSAVRDAAREDSLWMVRVGAVEALTAVASESAARQVLLGASRDDDSRVRVAAATALGSTRADRDVVVRLRELVRSDRSGWVRAAAMRALGLVDTVAALDAAPDMLRRSDWRDLSRVAALESLARIRSAEARALIVEQLDRGHAAGRLAAISALVAQSARPDPSAVAALTGSLSDDDPFVRAAAASAIGRLGDASAVSSLRERRAVEQEPRVMSALDHAIQRLGS